MCEKKCDYIFFRSPFPTQSFTDNNMNKSQNYLETFMTNPGFEHLGQKILRHLKKKNLLALRLVNNSTKDFVDNPKFWLKKMNYKNRELMELHEAWSKLIKKVEEEHPDLKKNIALNLIKLNGNEYFNADDIFERVDLIIGYKYMNQLNSAFCRGTVLFPLNILSLFGDLALVEFIIENNMVKSLSRNSWYGTNPFHHAAGQGYTEIVKALVGCIDNPNAPSNHGVTPIHCAAVNGHTEIVNILIGLTDNPNVPDANGDTPIIWAALSGHVEIVKTLFDCSDAHWAKFASLPLWCLIFVKDCVYSLVK